nr:hypothetical protein [Tanacetum cinerariifolium]
MQKNLALIAKYFKKIYKPSNNNLRTSLNSRNKNVDTSSRYKNDNQTGQFRNKRTMTVAGARETIELEAHYSYMAKIQEVPTTDSGTDTESLEHVQYNAKYNVFANERHHSEQPESISNTCVVEKVDSNVIPNSLDMCDNDIQTDQNAIECDDERVALANLIANLKLDVDENKKIQNQLKKANSSLAHELKECKAILAETSRTLGESNSIRDRLLAQKEIDIKEGLKLKAYKISVVKEKYGELVKQSFLTKSYYEGLVKEKTKLRGVITLGMERGCLSQKGSRVGRGVKENDLNRNNMNTSSSTSLSMELDDTMKDDTPVVVATAATVTATTHAVDMTVEKEKRSTLDYTNITTSAANAPDDTPVVVATAATVTATTHAVDMTIEKEKRSTLDYTTVENKKLSSLEDTTVLGSFPPLPMQITTSA